MIKHHPAKALIEEFVQGTLPASLSAAISMHVEMCPHCQAEAEKIELKQAQDWSVKEESSLADDGLDAMMASITANDDIVEYAADSASAQPVPEVEVAGNTYKLPKVLSRIQRGSWFNLGKVSRASYQFDEGKVHANILHIEPGGSIPDHTHNGYELTLLLDGSFSDEYGEYHKGDFIMLDGSVEHNPVSQNGCLCFTVADDSLQFTKGMSKLLNPIGGFIY